jgi:hypothetical protein
MTGTSALPPSDGLTGPDLIATETLRLSISLYQDRGERPEIIFDVMFRTVLAQLVESFGPAATLKYLTECQAFIERAAQALDSNGLSEMPSKGSA